MDVALFYFLHLAYLTGLFAPIHALYLLVIEDTARESRKLSPPWFFLCCFGHALPPLLMGLVVTLALMACFTMVSVMLATYAVFALVLLGVGKWLIALLRYRQHAAERHRFLQASRPMPRQVWLQDAIVLATVVGLYGLILDAAVQLATLGVVDALVVIAVVLAILGIGLAVWLDVVRFSPELEKPRARAQYLFLFAMMAILLPLFVISWSAWRHGLMLRWREGLDAPDPARRAELGPDAPIVPFGEGSVA